MPRLLGLPLRSGFQHSERVARENLPLLYGISAAQPAERGTAREMRLEPTALELIVRTIDWIEGGPIDLRARLNLV